MNPTSSVVTGGITISAATLQPAVSWLLVQAFHTPVPDTVSALVTGLVAAAVHVALNELSRRYGSGGTSPVSAAQ